MDRLINELSLRVARTISPERELVVFDEIQECPKALTSLKYFCEDKPELALACAGSLLGVAMSEESFPVGKVEFLDLYPMTFREFLSSSEQPLLEKALAESIRDRRILISAHERLWDCLKQYYFVGGMPDAVTEHWRNPSRDAAHHERIRALQRDLVDSYYKDIAKHSGKTNSMHIVSVFENIPRQLAQNLDDSVKRYRFRDVLSNKRSYPELRGPIDWLVRAGLALKTKITGTIETPLEAFCRDNIFKLYLFDVGLLGGLLNLSLADILDDNYGIMKGYFSENFVAAQLVSAGISPLYGWNENTSEVEFLQTLGGRIVPIEVKSGKRVHAKSLANYILRHKPETALIVSARPMRIEPGKRVREIALYQTEYVAELAAGDS